MKGFCPVLKIPPGYGTFRLLRGMVELPTPGLECEISLDEGFDGGRSISCATTYKGLRFPCHVED